MGGADPIAVVQGSPDAVAAHDKAAWLALFAPDGLVNDPVGSVPHVGTEAVSKFYDMFIAPNDIVFEVAADVVCGEIGTGHTASGATVVRDLTVHTTMAPGVVMHIPMHLRYDLVDVAGEPRIAGLYAHWELVPMVRQLLATGLGGARVGAGMGPRMLRTLGPAGMLGFASGARGVGAAGKRRAADLAAADGFRVGKVLAAGREVTISVDDGARRGVLRYVFPRGDGAPELTSYLAPPAG